MAAVKNFTLDQGSDKTVSFILSDKNGPLDLTGYSAAMQLRRYAFSEEAIDRTRAPQASHFNGR